MNLEEEVAALRRIGEFYKESPPESSEEILYFFEVGNHKYLAKVRKYAEYFINEYKQQYKPGVLGCYLSKAEAAGVNFESRKSPGSRIYARNDLTEEKRWLCEITSEETAMIPFFTVEIE